MSEPFGRYLLNQELPDEYKIKSNVTKGALKKDMFTYARKDPEGYAKSIVALKRIGDMLATQEGLSIGLEDITPQYAKRNKEMQFYVNKFKRATSDSKKQEIAIQAQKAMVSSVIKHPGSLTLQVASGARGNTLQYSNMVNAVGAARDSKGGMTPWLISHSYAEGLTPAEYFATTNQSLMDVVKSNTAVSEPGELNKKLINVMYDSVITEDDCGTHNGVMLEVLSPDAIDRYTARDVAGVKRNTLITTINQGAIAKKHKKLLLRSPMTCEAADGVCQLCQGLNEHGSNHILGINVGVRSAAALSEPLTQFALNSKHGGRNIDSDKNQAQGISGFRQMLETPKVFINRAALATLQGKVDNVSKAPQGGTNIDINGVKHYALPGMRIYVTKGSKVEAGDVLSEGIPKPDELVKYKGLSEGRNYLVNSLKNLYKTQGRDLDRRHFELLAKSNMNHVRILDDKNNAFIKGDIVNYNTLRSELTSNTARKDLSNALGDTLGHGAGGFLPGTRITSKVYSELKKQKINEVLVAPRAPSVEFVMKSATLVPKLNEDWMARMSHQGLKRSILQAAHTSERSNLHGTHPIPAYAYGAEFGEGTKGRY